MTAALRMTAGEADEMLRDIEAEAGMPIEALGRPGVQVIVRDVVLAVCRVYGVTHGDLVSPRRFQGLARSRQVAMLLAHELTLASLPAIGLALRRDHTTVIHGIKAARLRTGPDGCPEERERAATARAMAYVLAERRAILGMMPLADVVALVRRETAVAESIPARLLPPRRRPRA